MPWEYEYNEAADETTIRWVGSDTTKSTTIDGEITEWCDGYPVGAGRDVVANMIQSAGTPQRIKMGFDLNYGFTEQ